MNRKVVDFTQESISKIVLKKPKVTTKHTLDDPEYICEIWYLDDGKLHVPIFQTPRLRVKYKARQWEGTGTGTGSWSYCTSLYNYDIDPEIMEFYESIRALDRHIVEYYTTHRSEWTDIKNIRCKYFPAMRRKAHGEDPYLSIKLISDYEDGTVLTIINNKNRDSLKPTDIVYNTYTDQYVSPSYILLNKKGIHPVWNAHQVVVSNQERVFLEYCLLDIINPLPMAPTPPPPPPRYISASPLSESGSKTNLLDLKITSRSNVGFGRIKKEELLSVLGKLKSTKPCVIPKGDRNKITPDLLMQKKTEIKAAVKRDIMYGSIKDIPVEGIPDPQPDSGPRKRDKSP